MQNLGSRALRGFVVSVTVMSALIFLSAGSFDYWQAWTFLGVYISCNGLLAAYLWKNDRALFERRMRAGPFAEKERAQKVIVLLVIVGYVALFVVSAIDHRLGWSATLPLLAVAGDVIIVAAFYFELLVLRENSFAGSTINVAADQEVVSTGPYAVVRHPMYAGMLFLFVGIPLALGSYWGLAAFALMMPVLVWRLLGEEAYLEKNLPGYPEYQTRVRWRLIPGIF
jgi:protein-S-isoprenylcysteine O-methyltransferase Ste14